MIPTIPSGTSLRDEILIVCKQVDMTMHREENCHRAGVTRPTREELKERIRWMYATLLKVVSAGGAK